MNSIARLVAIAVGLLVLTTTPSWGQPLNPTGSDNDRNTAGGPARSRCALARQQRVYRVCEHGFRLPGALQ